MMEAHRSLDQSLEIFLLLRGCDSPNVFEDLMRLKEFGAIEMRDSASQFRRVHTLIVTCQSARKENLAREREVF